MAMLGTSRRRHYDRSMVSQYPGGYILRQVTTMIATNLSFNSPSCQCAPCPMSSFQTDPAIHLLQTRDRRQRGGHYSQNENVCRTSAHVVRPDMQGSKGILCYESGPRQEGQVFCDAPKTKWDQNL